MAKKAKDVDMNKLALSPNVVELLRETTSALGSVLEKFRSKGWEMPNRLEDSATIEEDGSLILVLSIKGFLELRVGPIPKEEWRYTA